MSEIGRTLSHSDFVRVRESLAHTAALARTPKSRRPKPLEPGLDAESMSGPSSGTVSPALIYHLTYRDEADNETVRIVTLHRIDPVREGLKLVCYCHTAGAIRTFHPTRIVQVFCVVTGEVYDDPASYFLNHPMLTDPRDPEAYALSVCKHEVNVLVALGAADGLFCEDEIDSVLVHLADRLPDLRFNEDVLRKRLCKIVPDCRAFENALLCMGRWGEGDSTILLRSVRRLMDIDGQLSPEEFAFGAEIAARLTPKTRSKHIGVG